MTSKLTAAEIALLDSQLPEIGGAIRSEPVTPDGDGWRVGGGGSTKISKSGWWHDFKAAKSGWGALAFIAHYKACTPDEAIAWASSWLAQHAQAGPCGGGDADDDGTGVDGLDTLQRRAYIDTTYSARLPIAGTPAATYLDGRGIDPALLRPELVEKMGWLPDYRGTEGALVYPYTDEAGNLQGLHFTLITPDGEKSPTEPARLTRRGPATWRTKGRALLRLDFGTGPEMIVAEGFENALAISLTGVDRVVAVGAVGAYGRCPLPATVENIIIAHDGDDPNTKPAAAQAYHRGIVRYLGQKGLALRMTAPPIDCDPNDLLKNDGVDALKKLLSEARGELGKFDDAAFLDEICKLDDLAYDHARKSALKLLGLSKLDTLDKLRAATRKRWAETPGNTEVPPIPDDDQPWPEPVTDIGPVLDAALAEITRYVIAPPYRLATGVLWGAYAHVLPREDLGIDVAPRLGIRSKIKRSGKSSLLECIDNLTPNPLLAGSITAASAFRIIDATHATVLIDEADLIINQNSSADLRAVLNSGHRRRTAFVIRNIQTPDGNWVPTKFNTFTGIAFAGLETLPETLQDRCISMPLHRATRAEKPEHLRNGYSPVLIECRRKLARWAADLTEFPTVALPSLLFNRTGDNWSGLFSIAEMAGGKWPARAEQAAIEEINEEEGNRNVQLLEAIWQVFAEKKVVRMHTEPLLDALKKIEEAPWHAANNGREIDSYWLREQLKDFLPRAADAEAAAELRRSREWREGGKGSPLRKGYTEDHLREAWWRYLERQTPTETAKAAGRSANGAGAGSAAAPAPDPVAPDPVAAAPAPKKSASNGHGPAKRRTRPDEAEPVGEA